MAQHTKGPWARSGLLISAGRYSEILLASVNFASETTAGVKIEEATANAALISAAPELLEALKRLVQEQKKFFDSTTGTYQYNNDTVFAFAAINKAEGKQ